MEDSRRIGSRLMIEGEYMVFSRYASSIATSVDEDYDIEVAELMAITSRGKGFIESGIAGYSRLRDLPQLRALQEKLKLIDVPRLAAIDRTLCVLAPDTDAETFALIDALLVDLFTPKRPGTPVPSMWKITRALRRLIAQIDSSVDFSPEKRRQRERKRVPEAHFYPLSTGTAGLSLHADTATIASIDAFVEAAARTHKLSLADTLIKLLTGYITPEKQAILHVYSINNNAFIPRYGWVGEDVDTLFDQTPAKTIDLEAASTSRVAGYTPTPAMAAFVRARDGSCIFPGCHVPAEKCQLDHRNPYDEGGETTPANLYCLCQRHHNIKTDRRAFYVPDHASGETVWIFSRGSWAISEDAGIFHANSTPQKPRWKTTRDSIRAMRAKIARFNAACHTLRDQYETDGNYDACITAIRDLERESGLVFEYAPAPG